MPGATVAIMLPDRAVEGEDVAAILRGQLGDNAVVQARLDDAGRLCGYQLTLHFANTAEAFDGAARLKRFCDEQGWDVEVT